MTNNLPINEPESIKLWEQKYREGNETQEEFYRRQANALGQTPYVTPDEIFTVLYNQEFCLAGRPQYALGTQRKESTLSNCFVTKFDNDSLPAIYETIKRFGLTHKAGGGMGVNNSILRPKGAYISSTKNTSSGSIGWLKIIDTGCQEIKGGGNRRGANINILEVWHPDIFDYIDVKKTPGVLENFNLSVGITGEFMNAVINDEKWDLIFPDTTFYAYNDEWDGNIDNWKRKGYPVKVYQTVNARDLYDHIMEATYDYAEPGVMFIDTHNRYNPLSYCEDIRATNPCGEISLAPGGSCNLGAINLAKFVLNPFTDEADIDMDRLQYVVAQAVRALNAVVDINFYPLPEQKEENDRKRLIGLGIMGLADMLAMMEIPYGSDESYELAAFVQELIRNAAYSESIQLAKDYGSFEAFDKEKYSKTEYFKTLPKYLQEDILKYGIYNGRLLTIAPTGTTSQIANMTNGGLEPFFSLSYERKIIQADGTTKTITVSPYAVNLYKKLFNITDDKDLPYYFVTAEDLSPTQHINMQAVLQKYVDNSISKTINCPKDIDYEDFKEIYIQAWLKGLKGCTTYRPTAFRGSVLSTTKDNEPKVTVTDQVLPLEMEMKGKRHGITYDIPGKNGENNYITINVDDNWEARECFIRLPQEAGLDDSGNFNPGLYFDRLSDTDLIARLISLCLRSNIPIERVIKQLSKSSYNMFTMAHKLKNVLLDFIPSDKETEFNTCPECGGRLLLQEGCATCIDCNYSKCS